MLAANWSGILRVRGVPSCDCDCECEGCRVVEPRYTRHYSISRRGPVGDCHQGLRVTGGGWVQQLADNTILQLSELETGGVRHLGHQITNPPEQRRVVLLVNDKTRVSSQFIGSRFNLSMRKLYAFPCHILCVVKSYSFGVKYKWI